MEEHQKVLVAARLLGGDALTWWTEDIKDQEIEKNEMSWTEFKTLVTSRFIPEYANICAGVAWCRDPPPSPSLISTSLRVYK